MQNSHKTILSSVEESINLTHLNNSRKGFEYSSLYEIIRIEVKPNNMRTQNFAEHVNAVGKVFSMLAAWTLIKRKRKLLLRCRADVQSVFRATYR